MNISAPQPPLAVYISARQSRKKRYPMSTAIYFCFQIVLMFSDLLGYAAHDDQSSDRQRDGEHVEHATFAFACAHGVTRVHRVREGIAKWNEDEADETSRDP